MHKFLLCVKISTGDFMRLRNVKNKDVIMDGSNYLIKDASINKGKWKELFGNDNPIYIEMGMGKGQFIINNALKYPNINFIGIEKFDSVIVKALQKIPEGLSNLYMIRGNALEIDDYFDHEIDLIYLNFSDPWPKNRHHLRRLSSKIFLEKYDCIFKNKKMIEMRTDNSDLYTYSLVSFSNFGYTLEEVSLNLHRDNMPLITTEYEDKFSNLDMPIYYVKCSKD